ncbi:hypothetical protein ABPG74_008859 [Tetrahymena malaccensis]
MRKTKSQQKKQEKSFEYDNFEEIDQKFEQFSENYRNQSHKQTNTVQISLLKSILKNKGPTLSQQASSIQQLQDIKTFFLNNCESKIALVERLSSTRQLGDTPLNIIRSQTSKNTVIIKPDQASINDNKQNTQQQQPFAFYNKLNQNNSIMDISQTSNENFSRKNKKTLTFQQNVNTLQDIQTNNKLADQKQPNIVKQQSQADISLLTFQGQSNQKLQNSMLDFDSAIASTEIFSSQSQKAQQAISRQASLSNFSSLILRNGDQTPLKGQNNFLYSHNTLLSKEEINSPQVIQDKQKSYSVSGAVNQFSSPLKFVRERQRGNTIHIKDIVTPTPRASARKLTARIFENMNCSQRNTATFADSVQQQQNQPTVSQIQQNQQSSAYTELLQYKEQIRKQNKICQLIGQDLANFAIAAILLVQNRDKKESESQDITQKFLSAFGINRRALDSMRKEQDKRDYVIKQIVSQLKDQYVQWQTKNEARNKETQKFENQYKSKIEEDKKREREQKDQFKWLKINTFYSELENNLKSMVVMKINNFYNQNFLLDKIMSKKISQNNDNNFNQSEDKNQLENSFINEINNIQSNTQIFQLNSNDNQNTDQFIDTTTQKTQQNQAQDTLKCENQTKKHEENDVFATRKRGKTQSRIEISNKNQEINNFLDENFGLTTRKRGQTQGIIETSNRNFQVDNFLEENKDLATRKRGQTQIRIESQNKNNEVNNVNNLEKRDSHVIDEISNKLLFIQISQNEKNKQQNLANDKIITDALNQKLENTESQQKPLQKLYEKIKPDQGKTKQEGRSQSLNDLKGKFNPETLRQTYNKQLNSYIEQKQSENKGQKHIKSFQIVKLQEQIDNCLKLGQTISEQEYETEYRWLKDNMIKGLSKQEYLDKQKRVLYDNYYWNQETEDIFVKKRNQLQHRNFQSVKSNNFSELTIYEFMRLILKNTNVQDINRENLMKRYQKGEPLLEEQMEFLAATNQLLNKFIDKSFMKEAIEILEKNDILKTFELILAENILKSYNTVKNILYNHRETFLSHKNEYTRTQYDEKKKKDKEYSEFIKNLEMHKKKSKMYATVLNYLEKINNQKQQNCKKVTEDEVVERQSTQIQKTQASNMFSVELANTTQESINPKEVMINQKQKSHELTHPKSIDKIMKYYNYHPPTKIIIDETETPKNDKNQNEEVNEKNKNVSKIEVKDKLRIKKLDDKFQNKQKFAKFYSGGPAPKFKREINEKEHKVQILKIQSFFRMKLAQNVFKEKKYIQQKNERMNKLLLDQTKQRKLETNQPLFPRSCSPLTKRVYFQTPRQSSINNKIILSQNKRNFQDHFQQQIHSDLKQKINKLELSYHRNIRKERQTRGRADRLIQYVRENNFLKIKKTGLNYDQGEVLMSDKKKNTALYYAVKNGNCLIAKFLLEKGADLNQQCYKMNTPMHMAFKYNDINMIFLLLDYGADLNLKNNKGFTPLGYASMDTLQKYGLEEAIAKNNIQQDYNSPNKNTTIDNNKFMAQRESQNFEKALIIEQGMQTNFQQDQYRDSFVEHTPQRKEQRQSSIKINYSSPFVAKLEYSPEVHLGKSSFQTNFSSRKQILNVNPAYKE